jgi:hypothetical protein
MILLKSLISENVFLRGLCFEFAIALSQTFNYKLGVIVGEYTDEFGEDGDVFEIFAHAFGVDPQNKNYGIDFSGKQKISDMIKSSMFNKRPIRTIFREISEKELRDNLEIDEESILTARTYIQQNINKFKV